MSQVSVRPNLIFSDLDGTLFRGNATRLLLDLAYQRKFLDRSNVTQGVLVALLSRPLPYTARLRLGWQTFGRLLANKSYSQFQELAAEAAEFISSNLYPKVVQNLKTHQANGAKVVLVSASPAEVVQQVANLLGFTGAEASLLELSRDKTRLNGRTASPLCYGSEKVRRAQLACDRLNLESGQPHLYKLANSAYYADDFSDYYLLSKVAQPVAVNPEERLKLKALEQNWEIMYTT